MSAKLFIDKTPIKFMENYGLSLQVPKGIWNEIETVIELEVK